MFSDASILVLTAIFAGGGATACATYAIVGMIIRAREVRALARREVVITETDNALMKSLLPLARYIGMGMRGALDRTISKPDAPPGAYRNMVRRITRKLAAAGHPEGINADEYVGFCVLAALAGGLFTVFVHVFIMAMFDLVTFFLMGVLFGAIYMPLWLKGKTQKRQIMIRKELPFALDLLTLATEAGLDFTSALERIVRKLGNTPLGQEFQIMMREIRLGKSRSEAMRDLGRRVEVMEVQSVMTSLVQAEEMGSNIGPILRIQAAQQRERRSQRAEEAAGRAPVKLLFPIMLIMIDTVLIIGAAMYLSFST